MSQNKIKQIIAVVEIDGVDTKVSLTDLHEFCTAYSFEKVFQPANPMAPGTTDMFGIKLQLTTGNQFSVSVAEEVK